MLYKNGISIDLDFRDTILEEELKGAVVLVNSNNKIGTANEVERKISQSSFLPKREQWYKDFRLGHRAKMNICLVRIEDGAELLDEMKEQISYFKDLEYIGDFKSDLKILVDKVSDTYNVEEDYLQVLEGLIKDL